MGKKICYGRIEVDEVIDIIKTEKLVAFEKGKVEIKQFDVPEQGPDEVQIKVEVSLISPGTELAWVNNLPGTPGKFPFEPDY